MSWLSAFLRGGSWAEKLFVIRAVEKTRRTFVSGSYFYQQSDSTWQVTSLCFYGAYLHFSMEEVSLMLTWWWVSPSNLSVSWWLGLFAFYSCGKHNDQKQLGEEKGAFYCTLVHYSLSLREVRAGTQGRTWRREPMQRLKERLWLTRSTWLAERAFSCASGPLVGGDTSTMS